MSDSLGDFASQFGTQIQLADRTLQRERLDVLDSEPWAACSSETIIENERERAVIILTLLEIRVIDVAVKSSHTPVGFYVEVNSEDMIRRTSIRPASVGKDVVEWDDEIVLPSDRASKISLAVVASFELGVEDGEVLFKCEVNVGELLDRARDGKLEPIRFSERNDGEPSGGTSLEAKIERHVCGWSEHAAPPDIPKLETLLIRESMNRGLRAFIRYRELGEKEDLEESVKHFEHALDACPLHHPSRNTILFELATAKLTRCRINDESPNLDAPIELYQTLIRYCPLDHPDLRLTLLGLGMALEARSQRQHDGADKWEVEILSEALHVSFADSHAYETVVLMLGRAVKTVTQSIYIGLSDNIKAESFVDPEMAIVTPEVVERHASPSSPNKYSQSNRCVNSSRDQNSGGVDLQKALLMLENVVQPIPDGHPDRPEWINDLGVWFLNHYERFGDIADLEKSISLAEDAVQLTPDDHPDKPLWLDNLGISLSARYERFRDAIDLERSISSSEAAVRLAPDDHQEKPLWLNNFGYLLWTRYQHFGDVADLEKSVLMSESAVQRTPDDHLDKASRLSNLSLSLSARYQRFGDTVDLEKLISIYEDGVRLTPDDGQHKPAWLDNLGRSLLARYERFGDVADLEKSISISENAVQLTLDDHPDKLSRLHNLSLSLWAQYQRSGVAADMEKLILISEKAAQLMSDDHPDKPSWLNSLGRLFITRYEHFKNIIDLERSISTYEDRVHLIPNDHPQKPLWLINLGHSLLTRYQHFGDVADLEKSISMSENSVQLTPDDHPDKPSFLHNLASSIFARYEHSRDVIDLEKLISTYEVVVQVSPNDHPEKPLWLSNLGHVLLARYQRFGDVVDLEKSISTPENAVQLAPDDHPDKPSWLNNLGASFLTRYERTGDVADLEKSISMYEVVVRLTPNSHPDKPLWLNNFGHVLLTRYQRLGCVVDLDKSMSVSEDAVQLTPDGQADKPLKLSNLGLSFLTRYERSGDIVDLEKSIAMFEDSVRLTQDGHPDRPLWFNNLGRSLSTRYERSGDTMDLEKSISMSEHAVRLAPDDHPRKPWWLNNLGLSLSARYQCFGDSVDLEKSISAYEDAVRLTPNDHIYKPLWLNNLGQLLLTRYRRFEDVVDLEKSILMSKDTLQHTPQGHPDKPLRLSNLGLSFFTRYERFRNVFDLEKSISIFEDSIRLTLDGHPKQSSSLSNLSLSLLARYEHLGSVADLEKSISLSERVVGLVPDAHPEKSRYLNSLASALLERFQQSGDSSSSDLPQAILHSSTAARSFTSPSSHRLRASQLWIQCVRFSQHNPQSLLDAYTVAVDLLPQLAWIGLSLHDRYHQLPQAGSTTCDAATAAFEAHRPELAAEWLEQGRSIVWHQLLQLRTPVDDLRDEHPELAAQYEHVSRQLEQATARDGLAVVDEVTGNSNTTIGSLEDQERQHHAYALERENLLTQIRALPRFERFLLPKTIDQLASLAHPGPVVFLNASKYRCDALVVKAGSERVVHVPLSKTSYNQVAGMQLLMKKLLQLSGRVTLRDVEEYREGNLRIQGMSANEVFGSNLPYLWDKVVFPVLEALAFLTPGPKLPRIFWCPTGPFTFLPIHAAGHYGTGNSGPKVSDFVISSYIPTMSVFEQLPRKNLEVTLPKVRLLTVPQPSTDGARHLSCVKQEIEVLRGLSSFSQFLEFEEADGTVEDVLEKMKESDWVHFACHGTQDRTNALASGLLLAHGRRLRVSDIVQLTRPHGGLAFLSACQTAAGDEQLSEEAIHIAAGMLLAGYRGVIATMWTIMDSVAPKVTEDVYKFLLRDGTLPDSRNAAEALHHAVERLRNSGAPFLSWVPFIHVGS